MKGGCSLWCRIKKNGFYQGAKLGGVGDSASPEWARGRKLGTASYLESKNNRDMVVLFVISWIPLHFFFSS